MRLVTLAALIASPGVAVAQSAVGPPSSDWLGDATSEASQEVQFVIEGYARAATGADRVDLHLSPDSGVGEERVVVPLEYSTNLAVGQSVYVELGSDLHGVELVVTPVPSSLTVERMATGGSAGLLTPAAFTEPGSKPIITGVGQVAARVDLAFTARSLAEQAALPRELTVTYTVSL